MTASILPRRRYIQEQAAKGRRPVGVLPAQYPKEILWALDILPVEIWDPPLEVSSAGAHLQPYICSVVQGGLELILQGRADQMEAFLFPHTCDSIQNLATVVNDYIGLDRPCYFFYHPKAPYRPSSHEYYYGQINGLAQRLAPQFGPLDEAKLWSAVRQGAKVAELLRQLYMLRAQNNLRCSAVEFYELIRLGEYLHPDDFIPALEDFMAERSGPGPDGPAVVLSGVLPNPVALLSALDELGVRVGHDDLLACSRRMLAPPAHDPDPLRQLAKAYFGLPPCSTKNSPLGQRLEFLRVILDRSASRGVIFNLVKFCETELFDAPQLIEALKSQGVPTLFMETELNQGLSGQLATRVEAFVEMLG
ncbi:2-hydroxyglutaryl-CoA dehydratase D-component [Desulfarculus baarsii DSM 2075]|uniref:2-hydroxyglutaryl-CoA dehydratase D-component n=1 Tax=Desulfarculus baarsii (strain ATCC 33931 / DSM 2075 / LMG 7858 / VKM B-1802 / 2st14) TaxID=644282 RepID=E1QEE6_DESB2|nr:2-hydroxyacyl-CoA dehydratase family protein [Desulfarculus baarsii]ADK83932.1 2-hydroxyglutaryl-CoA dehydratase D-component [Desulfarculus baarsii DSM 2075]